MLYSMTAFARQQKNKDFGTLCWEIRAVNHRYLETYFQLPENFQSLEANLREIAQQQLHRGKLNCQLTYQPANEHLPRFTLNQPLLIQLKFAIHEIMQTLQLEAYTLNPLHFLQWPGVIQLTEPTNQLPQEASLQLFIAAIQELKQIRRQEGQQLSHFLQQLVEKARLEIDKVRTQLPEIVQKQQDRLLSRFANAQLNLATERLEQEMLLFMQKIDVAEEIERLSIHLDELQRIINHHTGASGRRLDFLLQELNREANTLAAKSVDIMTTHAAVELKVLFEQMREQVQNIE